MIISLLTNSHGSPRSLTVLPASKLTHILCHLPRNSLLCLFKSCHPWSLSVSVQPFLKSNLFFDPASQYDPSCLWIFLTHPLHFSYEIYHIQPWIWCSSIISSFHSVVNLVRQRHCIPFYHLKFKATIVNEWQGSMIGNAMGVAVRHSRVLIPDLPLSCLSVIHGKQVNLISGLSFSLVEKVLSSKKGWFVDWVRYKKNGP